VAKKERGKNEKVEKGSFVIKTRNKTKRNETKIKTKK